MSFQRIEGKRVFVVDIDVNPKTLLPINDGNDPEMEPYALALNSAINQNIITGPGKYAIEVTPDGYWNVFRIDELENQ